MQQNMLDKTAIDLDLSDDYEILLNSCKYYNLAELPKMDFKPKKLTICHWNIRSLLSKITNLRNTITILEQNAIFNDIISLNETFLSEDKIKLCSLNGYQLFENHRRLKKGGGVCLYVHTELNCKHRPDLEIFLEGRFESAVVEIKLNNRKFLVCSLYRPPNGHTPSFIKQYKEFTSTLTKKSKDVIICGDLNIDPLKTSSFHFAKEFLDFNLEQK